MLGFLDVATDVPGITVVILAISPKMEYIMLFISGVIFATFRDRVVVSSLLEYKHRPLTVTGRALSRKAAREMLFARPRPHLRDCRRMATPFGDPHG